MPEGGGLGFFKERKPRSFEEVKNEDEVIALLKDDFRDKKLHIKFSLERREVTVNEFMDDRSIMVVTDPDYEPEEKFTIYGLLDKYFEIDLKVEEVRGPGYLHCSILRLRKALRGRRDLRFRMSAEKGRRDQFQIIQAHHRDIGLQDSYRHQGDHRAVPVAAAEAWRYREGGRLFRR